MQAHKGAARSGRLDWANLVLAALAGASLLFMVVLITLGVVLRYVFAAPILGLNEILQLNSVVVVMLALPWATSEGVHVRVDVLDHTIGRRGRFVGDLLARAVPAAVLAVLVWRAALKALDALRYGDASNMLSLPIWPFYAVLAIGIGLCVLILTAQVLALWSKGMQDD